MENVIYNWKFSEDKNRWKLWYIIWIALVIWIWFWWIITKQYWLTVALFLWTWVMIFIENNSSWEVNVSLNSVWIQIENKFYDYWKIESFSIIYNKSDAIFCKLLLNQKWLKTINLKVDNKIAQDLKNILPNFIKEDNDLELSFLEKIIILFKL